MPGSRLGEHIANFKFSLLLPRGSLTAPLYFLDAPSEAALLPFPNRNSNLKSLVWGLYSTYIYRHHKYRITNVYRDKMYKGGEFYYDVPNLEDT